MEKAVTVTADDFGLTESANGSILEAVDRGAVNRVSVLANGYAVTQALAAWSERKERLALSLHLNLTEGKALSRPEDIPHLVDASGTFVHSAISLYGHTLFPSARRAALLREIRHELGAQVRKIREMSGDAALGIDGHQHVHMVPVVLEAIMELHAEHPFAYLRVPEEPFFLTPRSIMGLCGIGAIRHFGLNRLSRLARRQAQLPSSSDRFIGSLLSGCQERREVESALMEAVRQGSRSIEIALHPGLAKEQELGEWSGDRAWHVSSWRVRERELAQDPMLERTLAAFSEGTLSSRGDKFLELSRFAVAGALATGTNLGLLYVFTDLVGLWYLASAIGAYAIATVVSFTLQKFWTFTHHSLERTHWEFFFYVLNNLLGVGFDLVGLYVLVEYAGVWYMAAQFILLALIATWNFFIYRFLIFKLKS